MNKLLWIFLFFAGHLLSAQLVDDSTKNVYSASTTFLTTERLIKNNLITPYTNPDTSIYLLEKYSRADASNRQLQHLGFLGSALLDQRYGLLEQPGRTFGFSGYNPYFKSIDEIAFFDTKSPFMDIGVIFGGENRAKIDFGFSRNVNKNWNIGFNINRITADKQIAKTQNGDRSTESASFDLYTHYKHHKNPYELAFSLTSFTHKISDTGGVLVEEDANRADFFRYQDALTQLEDAVTQDKRLRFHLYHQYKLVSKFQLYHQFDKTDQEYEFTDMTEVDAAKFSAFYPMFNLNTDTTNEQSDFSSSVNEAGIKGETNGVFYRFYVKHRSLVYDTKYTIKQAAKETYAGTYLQYNWQDKFEVTGNGELSNEGLYKLKGELSSTLVRLSYTSVRSSPSFQSLHYEGNHHNWDNSFKAIFTNYISGQLNLKRGRMAISPKASLTLINNFVYMNADQVSTQASNAVFIRRFGGDINFEIFRESKLLRMDDNETFRFENEVLVTNVSKNPTRLIKVPTLLYTGKFFWRGTWFENTVPVEVGTNFYYRTAYKANAYDPVTSQFYLQNDLKLKNYLAVDLFVNMKIRNVTVFMKWTHINQNTNDGYMTAPFYPGQKTIIDFGVKWLFFD